jgi:hypothetical protein
MDYSKIHFLLLLITFSSKIQAQEIAHNFTIEKIPLHFIKTERDSLGYLIYKPCDGTTPKVDIANNYISLQGQLESDWLRICKYKKTKKNTYRLVCVDGHDDVANGKSGINVLIRKIDTKRNLWLVSSPAIGFNCLMVPDSIAKNMRVVDNPCLDRKITEKTFLTPEF